MSIVKPFKSYGKINILAYSTPTHAPATHHRVKLFFKNAFFGISRTNRLSYLLELFWHSLAKFNENPRNGFSAKSQKLQKLAKNGLFFAQMSGFRENGQKSKKIGRATFLTFLTPNFMPSFEKILGAVSEIMRYTGTHTHGQT